MKKEATEYDQVEKKAQHALIALVAIGLVVSLRHVYVVTTDFCKSQYFSAAAR